MAECEDQKKLNVLSITSFSSKLNEDLQIYVYKRRKMYFYLHKELWHI